MKKLSNYRKSWAVVIGINNYQNVSKLQNAVNDATELAKVLRKNGFDKVWELYDEKASRDGILDLFLNNGSDGERNPHLPDVMHAEDRLLVFYAGHGVTIANRRFGGDDGFIVPYDGDINKLTSLIEFIELIRSTVRLLTAKHVLFLLDCCFSGIAALTSKRSVSVVSRSQERMQTQAFIDACTRKGTLQVIAAGQGDEQVGDTNAFFKGHSPFSGALIKGLKDMGADLNHDGVITATELSVYLQRMVHDVENVYGHKQMPVWNRLGGDEGGDFVITATENLNLKKPDEPQSEIIRRLVQRPLTVSTLSARGYSGTRLKEALEGKPIYWGAGPPLAKGSILAIFIPKNAKEFVSEHRNCIPFLFHVRGAARKSQESSWNYWIPIGNAVILEKPLTLEEMKDKSYFKGWKLPYSQFRGAGKVIRPLQYDISERFWTRVVEQNPSQISVLKENLLDEERREMKRRTKGLLE